MTAVPEIAERAEAQRVLSDPGYDVVPYHDRYAALGARLGLDFENILFLLDHLPLAIRGAAHEVQRADVARLIAENKPQLTRAMPGIVAQHLAVLSRPGRYDLITEAVLPLVGAVIEGLVDTVVDTNAATLVSRVFSQAMGVAQRRILETELARLRAQLASGFREETALRAGSRLALVVLGRDALIGTVSRSLHAHFEALDGVPLSSRAFPEVPSQTGVPYVDRVSVTGGPSIRCSLQSFEGGTPAERQRFFGAGSHVCLGRSITLDLFQRIADYLASLQTRVTVETWHLRKDDVFALPDQFTVSVAP